MALQILSKKELFKGKFSNLWETKFLDREGKEQIWEWMKKPDFVVVLAITTEKELVILKHFRIANEKYCYQAVAGVIDAADKSPEEAGHRELLEETGYVSNKLVALRPTLYAPGSQSNTLFPFIALNAERVNGNSGDATEDIEVVKIPADKLYEFYNEYPAECDFSQRIIAMYEIAKQMKLV